MSCSVLTSNRLRTVAISHYSNKHTTVHNHFSPTDYWALNLINASARDGWRQQPKKVRLTYIAPKAAYAASVALCNTRQGCGSAYTPQLKPTLTDFGMQPCSHTALVFRLVVSTRVVHVDYYSFTDLAKPPEGARGRYLKTLDKDCAPQIRVRILTHAPFWVDHWTWWKPQLAVVVVQYAVWIPLWMRSTYLLSYLITVKPALEKQ